MCDYCVAHVYNHVMHVCNLVFQMKQLLQRTSDPNLRFTLEFGIGLHHAGLHERDRKIVEELFVNQKIHVSERAFT